MDAVSREVGVGAGTLERWLEDAQAETAALLVLSKNFLRGGGQTRERSLFGGSRSRQKTWSMGNLRIQLQWRLARPRSGT
jgi:hypothetical protein